MDVWLLIPALIVRDGNEGWPSLLVPWGYLFLPDIKIGSEDVCQSPRVLPASLPNAWSWMRSKKVGEAVKEARRKERASA